MQQRELSHCTLPTNVLTKTNLVGSSSDAYCHLRRSGVTKPQATTLYDFVVLIFLGLLLKKCLSNSSVGGVVDSARNIVPTPCSENSLLGSPVLCTSGWFGRWLACHFFLLVADKDSTPSCASCAQLFKSKSMLWLHVSLEPLVVQLSSEVNVKQAQTLRRTSNISFPKFIVSQSRSLFVLHALVKHWI